MKLTELNPHWVHTYNAGDEGGARVGVRFDCPLCRGAMNGDFKCDVYVPFDPPLDGGVLTQDGGRRWRRTGETFETLTLSPSVNVTGGGCKPDGSGWHGFVTNGEVTTC